MPKQIIDKMSTIGLTMTRLFNRFHVGYWSFEYNFHKKQVGNLQHFCSEFKAIFLKAKPIKIDIRGNKRWVYQIGMIIYPDQLAWIKVPKNKIFLNHHSKKSKLDVYIQEHAINRLNERLDIIDEVSIRLMLLLSIEQLYIVTNRYNQRLLTYYFGNFKLGYLVIEPLKNMLIIKTFLPLCCESTPEGEKLSEAIPMEKEDLRYLKMDKLSSFTNSDIKNDKDLYRLFVESGCEGLFNIDKIIRKSQMHKINNCKIINKYIEAFNERCVKEYDTA